MPNEGLSSTIEALLFAAGEAVPVEKLARLCEVPREAVEEALADLADRYRRDGGLSLVFLGGAAELVTHPDQAPYIEKLSRAGMQEGLSRAALEVLSIVAYRGPVSRSEIEAIRGVNCQFSLRNLLLRGLIEKSEKGTDVLGAAGEVATRGYIYSVSADFLKHLGLERIGDLPDYGILSQDERLGAVVRNEEEPSETV